MNQPERLDLGDLPSEIAAVQQRAVDNPHRLRSARTQLLLSARGRTLAKGPSRLAWLFWAPVALTVAIAMAALVIRSRDAVLGFETSKGVSGEVGATIQAPATAPMTLRFSDGTALSLSPGSRARVDEVGEQGAGVVLEDGALQAAVVHRAETRWLVHAGPYRVQVTGTRFDVRWDAKRSRFDLDLHEGSVTVFGPTLGTGGKALLPRQSLHLGSPSVRVDALAPEPSQSQPRSAPSEQPPAPPSIPSKEPPAAASISSKEALSAASTSNPRSAAPASWKELALAGDYPAAFTAAEKEGFSSICRQGSSSDLLLLGNTARIAKKNAQAEQAFLAARTRPGAAHQHAVAAFQLGRLAQDARGDHARAATWFEAYLNESPAGSLAREAAGRVMEAHHRAGNASAAKVAARRYLERYPGGPYEPLARSLSGP